MHLVICDKCGQEKIHAARGLCKRCYRRWWWLQKHPGATFYVKSNLMPPATRKCSECKNETDDLLKGKCRKCYNKEYNAMYYQEVTKAKRKWEKEILQGAT